MSRFHSYCNTAAAVLSSYDGQEPFSLALKKFFTGQKKFGSRDRKMMAHLCYCYFRAAALFDSESPEEKIIKGLFLCSTEPDELLKQLRPEWNERIYLPAEEKIALLSPGKTIQHLFPFAAELSGGIDASQFSLSHLIQPDFFLRIRPGYEETVVQKLKAAGISYRMTGDSCIALPNATKAEQIVELNKEAVVQDYSSQRVGELLQLVRRGLSDRLKVWDCCAASGGKSILAKDILGDIDLTVSDVRESLIHNLKRRFQAAEITRYKNSHCDLTHSPLPIHHSLFDFIICDTPCTGSGTWGRTPEQLFYFNREKIDEYALLQRKIVSNALLQLKPGGHLLYITCSVFRKENEEAVEYLKQQFHLQLIKMELLKGYDKKADTMFAALLAKPL
ncbi:MAG: Fmu (Sun) domain-containing protein [Bacteroidota bacterium]